MDGMKKVDELEKTLFSLKMQANDLEKGIRDVEKELWEIKNARNYYNQRMAMNPGGVQMNTQVPTMGQQPVNQPVQMPLNQPAFSRTQQSAGQPYPQSAAPVLQRKNTSTESWVGKILMGVFASLLVFIALITFAKLIMPFITEPVKIILMFTASLSLTATGFVLNKKKPANTFFTALLACGTACVYLSIIVTKVHFSAISPLVMYALLAVWAVVVILLGKDRKDWLFFVIGNSGFVISAIFAAELKDQGLIIPMLVYIVVLSAAYQVVYWKNQIRRNVQSVVNAVSLLILELAVLMSFGSSFFETYIVSIVTIVVIFGQFILYLYSHIKDHKSGNYALSLINLMLLFAAYLSFAFTVKMPAAATFAVVFVLGAILEISIVLIRNKGAISDDTVISAVFAGVIMTSAIVADMGGAKFLFDSGAILALFAVIAAYGMIKKDMVFKTQGWVLVVITAMIGLARGSGAAFNITASVIALAAFSVEGFVINRSVPFKIVSYLNLLFWMGYLFYRAGDLDILSDHKKVLIFAAVMTIAGVNAVLNLIGFYRTKEIQSDIGIHIVLDIINALAIIITVFNMTTTEGILRALYMLGATAFACVNLPVGKKATKPGILYAGIKYGLLLFLCLTIYDTPDFVVSVCMILFAVICIAAGFHMRNMAKGLRIFGLVLTMLFVVKFIIVDISFDSSVTKALSYLASGILCFGISAIYNHFEKQGQNAG